MNLSEILGTLASLVTVITGLVIFVRFLQEQNRRRRIIGWFFGVSAIILFLLVIIFIGSQRFIISTVPASGSAQIPVSSVVSPTPTLAALKVQRPIPCHSTLGHSAPVITLNTISFDTTQQRMIWAFTFTNTDSTQNNYLGAGPGTTTMVLQNQNGAQITATGPATMITLAPSQTLNESAFFALLPSPGSHYDFTYNGGDECVSPVIPFDF